MLVPDQQVDQQPQWHMQVVHDGQGAAIDATRAFVPPVHAQRRRTQAEEQQHDPLGRCFGQVLRVAEHQERGQHHRQRTQIKVAKTSVMRQVAGVARHQMFVQHLPGSVGEVGHLQQQEAAEKIAVQAS